MQAKRQVAMRPAGAALSALAQAAMAQSVTTQPATIVSGRDADHDVPISVIAKDPGVLRRIDGWHWETGLHPSPTAPVLRMDRFRDRFLAAYAR